MPPAGLSWRETGCLSLEKLPNPLCQFGSCCWCMMGKKNIPPSLFYPLWKAPWPEFRFTWIISGRWGRHDFLYLSYQISLLDIQGEILVIWGWQLDAPGVKTLENRRRAPRRQREKQAKCGCAVESCSPRFTVIQGITTLFNNSGWTVKGRRGGLQKAKKAHENDREEKNLTTRPSQEFKFWRCAKMMLYIGVESDLF